MVSKADNTARALRHGLRDALWPTLLGYAHMVVEAWPLRVEAGLVPGLPLEAVLDHFDQRERTPR